MNSEQLIYAECEHAPPCLLADGADTPCGASMTALGPVGFYVTARNGKRTAYLLGPYDSKAEAEADVSLGSRLAGGRDPHAHSYAYGTAKVTMRPGRPLPEGRLSTERRARDLIAAIQAEESDPLAVAAAAPMTVLVCAGCIVGVPDIEAYFYKKPPLAAQVARRARAARVA